MRAGDGTTYEIVGTKGAPLIALIHGLGLNRQTWREFVPSLAGDYRVLTYDLLGHGESPDPEVAPTLSTFSEQLYDLVADLGEGPAVMIGFSLGGMINRRVAMDYPNAVSALVILNSPHERGELEQRLVEERATESAAGGPAATIEATLERWFTADYRAGHPEAVDEVRQWVLSNDIAVYAKCRWVLAHGVVELIRPTDPITHPALVMTGEFDSGSTPQMSRDIAAEIPGAQSVIIPGLKHMGLFEQPERFLVPLRSFLGSLGLKGH